MLPSSASPDLYCMVVSESILGNINRFFFLSFFSPEEQRTAVCLRDPGENELTLS